VSTIANAWATLVQEARQEKGWHVRRVHPEAACEIFAGTRQPGGTPGLILELATEDIPAGLVFPRSNGFLVEPLLTGGVQAGRVRFVLTLLDRSYEAVFAVLCEDVAGAAARAATPRQALRDWTGRLHVWQAFLAVHGAGGMSEQAVVGLLGELLVLRDELIPRIGTHAALGLWTGPRGEPNDFALHGGFLEVKSTARQAPEVVEIANLAQLDDTRGPILLVHVRLRPDPQGLTLSQMVQVLREMVVRHAADRLTEYHDLLMGAGYVDAQADLYRTAYALEYMECFRVGGDFPRVKKIDLRMGVRNCSYSIELEMCRQFPATSSAIQELLGGMNIG
jgi:hypothetical protein